MPLLSIFAVQNFVNDFKVKPIALTSIYVFYQVEVLIERAAKLQNWR